MQPITTALVVIVVVPTTAAVEHYHMLKHVMYILSILSYFTARGFGYLHYLPTNHQALQHEWPNEWKAVNDALVDMTAKQAVTSNAKVPAVHEPSKRKATNQSAGHVETSFAPPISLDAPPTDDSGSSSATKQSKLSQSWGESKVTAAHQAIIVFFFAPLHCLLLYCIFNPR